MKSSAPAPVQPDTSKQDELAEANLKEKDRLEKKNRATRRNQRSRGRGVARGFLDLPSSGAQQQTIG